MKTVAIIPAGGAGQRMGGRIPKQYLPLGGIPEVREDVVGKHGFSKVSVVVAGGVERQDSVQNALAHLREEHGIVLVHDAVRPFISEELIRCVLDAAEADG